MKYDLLLVASAQTLEPSVARAIHRYAASGGKIAFIEHLPERSPGWVNATENDKIVGSEISQALTVAGKHAALVEKPAIGKLLGWTDAILRRFNVDRSVAMSIKDDRLFQIHHRAGEREIFFFSNQNRDKTLSFDAAFAAGDKTPWQWNPQTGKRNALTVSASGRISLRLEPLESLVLVFEPDMPDTGRVEHVEPPVEGQYLEIDGPWQTTFEHVNGTTFEVSLDQLQDLSKSLDRRLATFAGTVTYVKTFDANDKTYSFIDLGKVRGVSELTLNDTNLGVRWWGKHEYTIKGLKPGRNVLKVKVATVLCNYCKSLTDNPVAAQWTRNQSTRPIGLIGPVILK